MGTMKLTDREKWLMDQAQVQAVKELGVGSLGWFQFEDWLQDNETILANVAPVNDIKSDTIIRIIQSWLDWQESKYESEGVIVHDGTHVMGFPEYPTRGMLKNWISFLHNCSAGL
jgi:hypothetical protein